MKPIKILSIAVSAFFITLAPCFAKSKTTPTISGELKKWHKVTLDFEGPESSELSENNPFLNYRFDVTFTNGEQSFKVPGYFAADGNAGESGATDGNTWRVHFTPNKTGKWKYEVSFVEGYQIAVETDGGKSIACDGTKGTFQIEESDKDKNDFRQKGRLLPSDCNYLQFVDSKEYFVKGGAGSPENFLAFEDFDATYSLKKEMREGEAYSTSVKKYSDHEQDWKQGDPTWKNGKGKNIIGALNYLAEKGINSVYFLTMNVYGDGQDVWPWINQNDRTRFDCSKLDQWEIVLNHMQNLGMMAHVITQETENELLLDMGNTGVERKLYYRELIARFSHQLAIIWNLGEENGYEKWTPNAQDTKQRKAMSAYLKATDPYKNPVILHTHAAMHPREKILMEVLDDPNLDGPSFQIDKPKDVHAETVRWKMLSNVAGRNWIFPVDEIGHFTTGAMPDANDPDHDDIRSKVLWGNLMAGGTGVEWYFGYKYPNNDLNCETWRTRSILWDQTALAVKFFNEHLPFHEMDSADELTTSKHDYVFAKENEIYCIYLPQYEVPELDLSNASGKFKVMWFNPKTGGELVKGSVSSVTGGQKVKLGIPLSQQNLDWVVLLKR